VISIGSWNSPPYPEINSVPQGLALGPLLFAAMTYDISKEIDIDFLLYADDLVLYVQN